MTSMISACGLSCTDCPTFIATQANDDRGREQTARDWSKIYRSDIKPADINCDGCLATAGRLFNHCRVCEIRKCAMAKGLANCAACADYACAQLLQLFKFAPQAKANLDRLQAGG